MGRRDRYPRGAGPGKSDYSLVPRAGPPFNSVRIAYGEVGGMCARAAAHEAITPKRLVPDPASAVVVNVSPRAVYYTGRTSLLVEGPLRSQRRVLRHHECKLD